MNNNTINVDKLAHEIDSLTLEKFIAAKKFKGEKPGYLFKNGIKGLGYYKDEKLLSTKTKTTSATKSINFACFRCQKTGHFAYNCYETKDIYGNILLDDYSDEEEENHVCYCSYCDKEFDTKKDTYYHEKFYCKNK